MNDVLGNGDAHNAETVDLVYDTDGEEDQARKDFFKLKSYRNSAAVLFEELQRLSRSGDPFTDVSEHQKIYRLSGN